MPLYLSASFIIEEGFPLADLNRIAESMGEASREAGVPIITGDTKVVERGKADGVFISTAGVGVVPAGLDLRSDAARPGDAVIVSGSIGDHGVAVMSKRENLEFDTDILSDSAALHGLVAANGGWRAARHIRLMRDPTRGGIAATLNEIAQPVKASAFASTRRQSRSSRKWRRPASSSGLIPLNVANEGKLVVDRRAGGRRRHSGRHARPSARGSEAALIGHAVEDDQWFRADDHELRRGPHRRLAVGRTAAADLLSRDMRILLVCHSFNSLSQRLHVDLRQAGHEVSVELDIHDDLTQRSECRLFVAGPRSSLPSSSGRIPEDVWRKHPLPHRASRHSGR